MRFRQPHYASIPANGCQYLIRGRSDIAKKFIQYAQRAGWPDMTIDGFHSGPEPFSL